MKTRSIVFLVRMDKTTKIDRARNQIVVQEICTVGSMEKKRHGSNKEKKRCKKKKEEYEVDIIIYATKDF